MTSNTEYIYSGDRMLKIIEDGNSVRLKICPRAQGSTDWDESSEGSLSITLDRPQTNMAVDFIRKMRNRVWGADA